MGLKRFLLQRTAARHTKTGVIGVSCWRMEANEGFVGSSSSPDTAVERIPVTGEPLTLPANSATRSQQSADWFSTVDAIRSSSGVVKFAIATDTQTMEYRGG